jgi:hypothetical protein
VRRESGKELEGASPLRCRVSDPHRTAKRRQLSFTLVKKCKGAIVDGMSLDQNGFVIWCTT